MEALYGDGKKIWRDIYRWTFFLWGILFLVWIIWFLVAKRIPEFSQIKVEWPNTLNETISLPFRISRWWDFLVLPLWPATYALIYNLEFGFNEDQLNLRWNNWLCGFVIGAFILTFWIAFGYLTSLIAVAILLFVASAHSEAVGFMSGPKERIFSFSVESFIPSLLLNLSSGMTIGLFMVFSIGLLPGLVIGLASFLIMTLFQYTLVKFFRIIYYLFKLKILPWLGVPMDDC